MGRGLARSRSKSRMTSEQKRSDTRKRSLSKLKSKLEADGANWEESDDEYSEEPFEVEEESIVQENIQERYKIAANFANAALAKVVEGCVVGASVRALCKTGDDAVEEACASVFNKKNEDGRTMFKGSAFPTSVSVNDVTAHYAPHEGGADQSDVVLKDGDVAKVHLAVHIDGYVSQTAHTVIVGDASKGHERSSDVVAAAYAAAELTIKMMRPDLQNSNHAVTNMYQRVASDFDVTVPEGVLSHRVLRWNQIGSSVVISKKIDDRDLQFQEVEDVFFGDNEVWHVDVVMASGHDKLHCAEECTTIWRRNEIMLAPRIPAAHYVLKAVREKALSFPFSTRVFKEHGRAKLGIASLRQNDMIDPIPVMKTKKTEVTARFSWTVMLTPKGVLRLTGLPLGDNIAPEHKLVDSACTSIMKVPLVPTSAAKAAKKLGKKSAAKRARVEKKGGGEAMEAD